MSAARKGPGPSGTATDGSGAREDAATDLRRAVSLLEAMLEATADGLLTVDRNRRVVRFNRQCARMWHLDGRVSVGDDADAILAQLAVLLKDPRAMQERIAYLRSVPSEHSHDLVELVDGRVFEQFSRPQVLDGEIVGRVWTFRDVTDRQRAERAMRESESRYRRLFEESHQAIYVTGRDGHFIDFNPATQRLLGLSADDIGTATAVSFYVNVADRVDLVRRIETEGSVARHEVRLRSRDGREMECLLSSSLLHDDAGAVIGYLGIIEDVTDRARADRALRESEMKFRSLIEHATDTITVLDPTGEITYESPSLLRVLGYLPEALVGRNVFEFVHPSDQAATQQEFQRLVSTAGHTVKLEVRFLHGSGGWRTLDVIGRNLLDDPAVRGIVVNARDVSEQKEAEARLLHDAFHDKLTQLPNRALLIDRMAQFLRRARRQDAPQFAVLFLDLDRFKVVNDSLGHLTGDQLLIAAARRLEESLRPGDTVARIGGDEFTMLLDGTTIDEARVVADRVQQDFQKPFLLGDHEIYVTVSIGIATSDLGYRTPDEMLRDVDLAMYRAKDRGRARFEVFDTSMRAAAIEQLALETDLRHAADRGELEMLYQPIVNLDEGTLYGFEALIRWNHPKRGMLVPGDFTRLADDTGLIVPVGHWVLRDVCRQVRQWHDTFGGEARPVHVNVSAHQIARPDFISRVQEAIDEFGSPAHLIQLELTEGTMMENAEASTRTLRELKQLGVGLSIDDFGTGYSSLSYLHRFPTDSVKIDRSFVAQMGPKARDSSIVRTIVDLAHDLGMQVVAEGVETEIQASALRGMRCECAQGFHFSRAVPVASATQMIASRQVW